MNSKAQSEQVLTWPQRAPCGVQRGSSCAHWGPACRPPDRPAASACSDCAACQSGSAAATRRAPAPCMPKTAVLETRLQMGVKKLPDRPHNLPLCRAAHSIVVGAFHTIHMLECAGEVRKLCVPSASLAGLSHGLILRGTWPGAVLALPPLRPARHASSLSPAGQHLQ